MLNTKKVSKTASKKGKALSKKSAAKSTAKKNTNKKTVKKAAAKKTSIKKTVKKSAAKRIGNQTTKESNVKSKAKDSLREQSANSEYSPSVTLPEHAFWVNDGAVLHSLDELAAALDVMDSLVYEYHVTDQRHDFADWVENALACVDCAAEMRSARSPRRARAIVVTHLKQYKD